MGTDLPYIRFGRYQNETVKVTSIAVDGLSLNIQHALDQPLEDFTEIYVVHEYKLWDAKKRAHARAMLVGRATTVPRACALKATILLLLTIKLTLIARTLRKMRSKPS